MSCEQKGEKHEWRTTVVTIEKNVTARDVSLEQSLRKKRFIHIT